MALTYWNKIKGEIEDLPQKTTLVDADVFEIEDSEDNWTKKKAEIGAIVSKTSDLPRRFDMLNS